MPTRIELLEADIGEPIGSLIARAERRADSRCAEFPLTFVQGGEQIHRAGLVTFVRIDDVLLSTQTIEFTSRGYEPVTVEIREPNTDVVIGRHRMALPHLRPGDHIIVERGKVTLGSA